MRRHSHIRRQSRLFTKYVGSLFGQCGHSNAVDTTLQSQPSISGSHKQQVHTLLSPFADPTHPDFRSVVKQQFICMTVT